MRTARLLLAPVLAAFLIPGALHTERERQGTVKRAVDQGPSPTAEMAEETPPAEPPPGATLIRVYEATTRTGLIGTDGPQGVDEAADNLFHIHLDRLPEQQEAVWLEYDLRGLEDHDAVPRSINHALSIGRGTDVRTDTWTHQRERIAVQGLKQGRNSIWFHAPSSPDARYEVREVKLVMEPAVGGAAIVLTNARLVNSGGAVYVKGLLQGSVKDAEAVDAEGTRLRTMDGAFEGWVPIRPGNTAITITAEGPQGEMESREFDIAETAAPAPTENEEEALVLHEQVLASRGNCLTIAEAELDIPPHALDRDERITAIALPARDVPPTGQDLINVCSGGTGYRFLPDGTTFTSPVRITLPVDTARIPQGYGPEDVRTFYFDEDERRWLAVPRDSLQPSDGRVCSLTTHFTDYINGIIQVPESPETMGYTPTSIKDYKAGDVSAGITPIPPPQASNTGAATTRFPLKLPQGRQGMQPDLTIQYNSEGGNGWMGLGWNLSTPSITIETRWGVPRYDDEKETETYLLDGEMMSPVAHRSDWENRTSPKVFHTRVEGAFRKIERLGSAPSGCYWKVTDKDGTARYYGGDQDGLENNAVLRIGGSTSAIAKWMLRRVVDSNGNTITYTYDTVEHAGTTGSPNLGLQIYPKRIRYTGRLGGTDGPYSVEFDFNDTTRADKQINCRLGFKEVTANLLRGIAVKYSGDTIRSYRLNYSEGAFYKTRLDSIVEYDANGDRFYGHWMEYYDDVRQGGEYVPYTNESEWGSNLEDDDLSFDEGLNPFVLDADKEVSLLGGSLTDNYSFGGSGNIGPPGNPFLQTFTIGGSFGYGRSKGEGIATFADIDGDNLPDKVFRLEDGTLNYRRNLFATGVHGFDDPLPTTGLPGGHFSQTRSRSTNYGFELHAGPGFFGKNKNRSTTRTETFFNDRNGDGLMDVCQNGKVFFNTRDSGGQPHFVTSSSPTENPIIEGAPITLQTVDTAEVQAILAESPLLDVVRVWNAPYDGWVHIHAPIQLLEGWGSDFESYEHRDGVRAVIQLNDQEQCTTTIPEDDTLIHPLDCPTLDSIHVQKADKIYFRLQSVWDGAYDQVLWHPEIRYDYLDDIDLRTDTVPDAMRTDANDKNVFEYRSLDDSLLANAQGISFLNTATLHVVSPFTKEATSDTVALAVLRYDSNGALTGTVYYQEFADDSVIDMELPIPDFQVDSGDVLIFRISAHSNVEWQELDWRPEVQVTSQPGMTFRPCVDKTAYDEPRSSNNSDASDTRFTRPYVTDSAGSIGLNLEVNYLDTLDIPGVITLCVKKKHQLVAKKKLVLPAANSPFNIETSLSFNALVGDTFYVELTIPDRYISDRIYASLDTFLTTVPNGGLVKERYGIYTVTDSVDMIFGPGHYRWGQFCYNYTEAGDTLTDPINESLLAIDVDADVPNLVFGNAGEGTLDDVEAGNYGNPLYNVFSYMFANRERGAWSGYDDLTYVMGDTMSASRLGEDDVSFALTDEIGSTEASAPIKVSKENSNATSYGVNVVMGWGFSNSSSDGSSAVEMDAMDLDGDRYPDIVSVDRIQGTLPTGGYEDSPRDHSGGAHSSESSSSGGSVGGSYVKPNFGNSASPGAGLCESISYLASQPAKGEGRCNDAAEAAKTTIGFSFQANLEPTDGSDHVLFSWNDVNGDGLPDKVYQGGNASLNLGRSFLPPEPWDFGEVRSGTSHDYGYGGGISISNISFAFGVSASSSVNGALEAFTDVNGDGLIDIVTATEGDNEWRIDAVKFNTGCGFTLPQAWPAGPGGSFDRSRSVGESGNASFSYGFVFLFFKVVMNVNGTIGHGFSRTESQFADINGDGFPDLLNSSDDIDLTVRASTIRRTNLLQAVHSPFGAKWRVNYEVAGNTYELPQSKWVMKSLSVWDGFLGDGPDTTYTTFAYTNGKYDRRERETYGFGTVRSHEWDTEADELYRTTVQSYDVSGYYTKGLPLVKTVQDGDSNKFIETVNTYQLKLLNGSDAQPNYNSDNDEGSAFPALIRTDEFFYEGEATADISRSALFEYDAIGNVKKYTDLGFEGQDDEVIADITYHDLVPQYIKSTPESISVSVDGAVRRVRNQDIDQSTGNVTAIHQTIDNATTAAYELYYTAEGNLDSIVRPTNHKGQRMHYGYTYDDAVKTYVTEVRDAYGYHSNRTYEYRFGQLESTTDMNGEVTNYAIDDRGRVETVTGPYEIASSVPYTIKLEYFPEAVNPYSVVTHYDPEHPDGEGIRTVTFLDGQFRLLQVKKSAVISDGNGGEQEKYIVSGRVHFDAFGRSTRQFYPTVDLAAPNDFFEPADGIEPTTTNYDILDRELTVTLPDGATTSTAYSISAANGGPMAFKTQVTDALLNKKDSYTDVREREVARTVFGPQGDIWTTFHYNGIGELLDVTDDGGNVTSYTYDLLGRKLTYDHPDGGLTEFTYDPAGNLLTKNTANLRELFPDGGPIKYSYDHERVDTINYPRNFMNQVVYTYGDSTETEFNRVGRVKVQLDGSGGQEFFYGPLGEVEKTIRTIVVSQTDIRTFVSEERYDTWNRIQVMKYPDGDSVDYAYNTAGKLKHVTSTKDSFSYNVVDDIGYDKFEQRVYLKHGNGVETHYAYEPDRRRLSTLRVVQANGTRIMDNLYGYDLVNNVLSLENQRTVPGDGQGGPMSSTYQYDNLYRLTEATGHYTGSAREDTYTLTMAYDDLHNIRHKTQTHSSSFPTATLSNYDFTYAYDSAAPHTPSKVGYRAYDYDANGNLMDWDEDAPRMGTRHMAWDEENRLQAVNDAGYVSQYTYDAGGERVLKSHGGMEGVFINGAPVGLINHRDNYTIYVSPYLVHAEHGFTKHYYIEGQRVASRTGNGHFITGPMPSNGITAGRVDFASRFLAMQQAGQQQVVNNAPVPGIPTMGGYNGQPEFSGTPTYLNNIGTYAAPNPAEGWPMPPVPPGAPGTPPTTPMPTVTNETVSAGYAFVTDANAAEMNRYFFHPDHLGSASYITGTDGTARQHLEYMAFGEVFVEEQNAADPLDYLFNGKELDRVTGLYYYGARYYDPVASMWASVDPMAERHLGSTPFAYTLQNPLVHVDPNGMTEVSCQEGELLGTSGQSFEKQVLDAALSTWSSDESSGLSGGAIAGTAGSYTLGLTKERLKDAGKESLLNQKYLMKGAASVVSGLATGVSVIEDLNRLGDAPATDRARVLGDIGSGRVGGFIGDAVGAELCLPFAEAPPALVGCLMLTSAVGQQAGRALGKPIYDGLHAIGNSPRKPSSLMDAVRTPSRFNW